VAAHGRGREWATGAAEQLSAARAQRPAIQVMDAHEDPSSERPSVTDLSSASTSGNPGASLI
jgi:hypothetical protein